MPVAPDGGWGWVVVAAVTISNLAVLPIQQCFGLVFAEQFSKIGITVTQTSFILHLNATIMCSLGLINAPLLKKFSYRIVACIGTTFIFAGICIAAFSNSLAGIIVAYCIFIAIGQGMMYPAISLALTTYFRKKRSIAMGLTITLTGLGPIFMPQLIARLLERYSTTGTVLILAAIALHSFIGASLLRPLVANKISDVEQIEMPGDKGSEKIDVIPEDTPKKIAGTAEVCVINTAVSSPEEIALLASTRPEGLVTAKKTGDENLSGFSKLAETEKKTKSIFSKISDSLDLDLLRDNHFRVIILGMGVSLVSELNFAQMTPFVLSELADLTAPDIATIMSIQASADISGRLCVPLITQKFGWSSKNLYLASLLGSTVGRSILASWSNSYTIIIAVSILLGIAKGTKAVFQALVIPDNVTLEKLPAASGLLSISNGVLSMALGPLIGLVHDKTSGYVMALHFTSGLSLFCVVLWIGERISKPGRERAKKSSEAEENCSKEGC